MMTEDKTTITATPRRRRIDKEVDELRSEFLHVKQELVEVKTSVKDLVDAWTTANKLVSFIKWLSSIAAAIALLVEVWRHRGG